MSSSVNIVSFNGNIKIQYYNANSFFSFLMIELNSVSPLIVPNPAFVRGQIRMHELRPNPANVVLMRNR